MMLFPRLLFVAAAVGFATAGRDLSADTRSNPYLSIVERNPFGIKPQPAQPTVEAPQAQVAPLAKVVLTGVTSIIGPPKALLEITEMDAGKGATVNKRVLQEGERDGSIEVLSIDVVNNSVRIRNGTVETNVVFEVAKQGGSGPGVPGAMPSPTGMPAPAPPALPTPAVTSASASPMIISSRGGDAPGRANTGVSFSGAEVSPASTGIPSPTYYGNSSAGNSGYRMASVNTYGAPTALGAGNTARTLRGDAANQPQQPQVSLADNIKAFLDQAEMAKQNNGVIPSERGGWILPPMPGMDDHIPAPGH